MQVYTATYAGVQVAVKQLDASTGLGKAREEVLAAMSVAHDNVVHIVAVSMDPNFVDRCLAQTWPDSFGSIVF